MEKTSSNLPENTSIIIPRLVCRDPASEVDFCVRAFEAIELNKAKWPSLPSRAPAMDATSPVVIFIYVSDVDKVIERATGRGARVLVPLENQFWGDRIAWIIDPAGHVWTVATRIEQTTAEERTKRWEKILIEESPE